MSYTSKSLDSKDLRYKLLRKAQTFTSDTETMNRFQKCHRVTISNNDITIAKSEHQDTAFYDGVMNCGSVWVCPVCSARVSASRCCEVATAIDAHTKMGKFVVMLTFTNQHSNKDLLSEMLDLQQKAFERFWRNGSVRRKLENLNSVGKITATEVTVSKHNGWHPHKHVLLFIDDFTEEQLKELEQFLQKAWLNSLQKHNLTARLDIGLSLDGGGDKSKYLMKFSQELTLAQCKRGKDNGHYNPFALLQVEETEKDYFWAMYRFKEYAEAMKGKRQIIWSRGLKEHFAITETSDEQILNKPYDTEYIADINKEGFKALSDDIKLRLLVLAQHPNRQALIMFLDALSSGIPKFKYTLLNETQEDIERRRQLRNRAIIDRNMRSFEIANKVFKGTYCGNGWTPNPNYEKQLNMALHKEYGHLKNYKTEVV